MRLRLRQGGRSHSGTVGGNGVKFRGCPYSDQTGRKGVGPTRKRQTRPILHLAESPPTFVSDREVRLSVSRVKKALGRSGLLPIADSKVPSLVSIVAGAPVPGSWWGHPAGQLIYRVGEVLESDSDVLVARLWAGKLTLIHRRLWPALVRIGRSKAPWQMAELSSGALKLLARIERENSLRSDHHAPDFPLGSQELRAALRVLDHRLLILTRSVHTSTGAHALEAKSWSAFSTHTRTARFSGTVASAQLSLEGAAQLLSPGIDPRRLFPWARSKAKDHASNR